MKTEESIDFVCEDDKTNIRWVAKKKINGQTVRVEFETDRHYNKTTFWNICLDIMTKRKNRDVKQGNVAVTGRIGIDGLNFAYEVIKLFEVLLWQEYPEDNHIIYCYWLDKRRRDIYYWALNKIGYEWGHIKNMKVILKRVYLAKVFGDDKAK